MPENPNPDTEYVLITPEVMEEADRLVWEAMNLGRAEADIVPFEEWRRTPGGAGPGSGAHLHPLLAGGGGTLQRRQRGLLSVPPSPPAPDSPHGDRLNRACGARHAAGQRDLWTQHRLSGCWAGPGGGERAKPRTEAPGLGRLAHHSVPTRDITVPSGSGESPP